MPYTAFNAAMPTTAGAAKVPTGTTIKTMLQLATPSTSQIQIIEWGFANDGVPAGGAAGLVELIQTDVAATVTAHVASGVPNLDPNGTASKLTLGTSGTGYTATVEGTPAATRLFDAAQVAGLSVGTAPVQYSRTFMPDARPIVPVSKFLRVRVTFGAAVSMLCWIVWNEI